MKYSCIKIVKSNNEVVGSGDWSNPYTNTHTDLQVLLQTTEQLSVHVAGLRDPQALLLRLSQAVLQDAAALVGAVQLPSQLLQLVDLLLQVAVSHLLHLRPQLVHFILRHTEEYRARLKLGFDTTSTLR